MFINGSWGKIDLKKNSFMITETFWNFYGGLICKQPKFRKYQFFSYTEPVEKELPTEFEGLVWLFLSCYNDEIGCNYLYSPRVATFSFVVYYIKQMVK